MATIYGRNDENTLRSVALAMQHEARRYRDDAKHESRRYARQELKAVASALELFAGDLIEAAKLGPREPLSVSFGVVVDA
jgi:hypothetical protein